ncbi:MAG: hypothetical protein DHS20C16_26480 [Phycisphaerae bacterium]|nr:MAG: hypothetical protein DHS20C16_26480 [Phycisphaerae bacterium]
MLEVPSFILSGLITLAIIIPFYILLERLRKRYVGDRPMKKASQRSAKKILQEAKSLYSGELAFVDASPDEFRWLDRSFYDEATENMAKAGFRFVADVESLSMSRIYPNTRTFIRCFVSKDSTTTAAAYHVKIRGLTGILMGLISRFSKSTSIGRNIKTIDIGTEYSNHTFLNTENTLGRPGITSCPEITKNRLPVDTSFEELLDTHRRMNAEIMLDHGVEPIRITSREDLLASQEREHALICAHKKRVGFVTSDQFKEIAGGKLASHQQMILQEIENMQNEASDD